MWGYIIGALFLGILIGMFIMALAVAASRTEDK
jgi:uncharacterized membrane-anchored protein YhcB (DUF1043 family)